MSVGGQSDPFAFVPEAVRLFEFLETDLGFRRVREEPELVQYENDPICVDVIREVGVNVFFRRRPRIADGPRALWKKARSEWGTDFPLEYLAELYGVELDSQRSFVNSPSDVSRHLEKAAAFVARYGRPVLEGDDETYRKLGAIARRRQR